MPNPENIVGKGFEKHPERINKAGRPRKYVSLLKDQGYTMCEVNDCIQVMLSMDMAELKAVWDNPNATILEKTLAVCKIAFCILLKFYPVIK